jgi:hypothetical protein
MARGQGAELAQAGAQPRERAPRTPSHGVIAERRIRALVPRAPMASRRTRSSRPISTASRARSSSSSSWGITRASAAARSSGLAR